MKWFSILLSGILLFSACKPGTKTGEVVFKNALAYNDYIVMQQKRVQQMAVLLEEQSKSDLGKASQTLDSVIIITNQSIDSLQHMPEWKGNTSLRNNALQELRFYKKMFSEDYRKIIEIQKDGKITPEEEALYSRMTSNIDSLQTRFDAALLKSQQAFAVQFGFSPDSNDVVKDTSLAH